MRVFASVICLAFLTACNAGSSFYPDYETSAPASEAAASGVTISGSARTGVVYKSK